MVYQLSMIKSNVAYCVNAREFVSWLTFI